MPIECPNCQRVLNDGARFCNDCGARLTPAAASLESNNAKSAETVVAAGDPMLGRVLDAKYKLVARLGEGGMGMVYRAMRVHIGDEVAVKVLHDRFVSDEATVERFRREARAAAMLRHSNVVAIYDFSEAHDGDSPSYIVMELVEGESLRDLLKSVGRLDPTRAVCLMRDICAGVGAAHRRNIVHRDIKPDNIIVLPAASDDERETAKVVDFGIAKLRDMASSTALTLTGVVIGTPYYMSPEQCRGEHADVRADVYGLGAMLYEMLAGTPPFTAPTATGVVAKHLIESPPPLPAHLRINAGVEAAIMRALAKDPDARQPDATAFARELQTSFSSPSLSSSPPAERAGVIAFEPLSSPPQASSDAVPPRVSTATAPPHEDRPNTLPLAHRETTMTQAPSSRRTVLVAAVTALATIALVAAASGALRMWRGDLGETGSTVDFINRNAAPTAALSPAASASPAETKPASLDATTPPRNASAPATRNPAPSESPVVPDPTPRSEPSPDALSPVAPRGNFLVILGSFTRAERGKAEQVLGVIRSRGHDARIINSDDYPNLSTGLWVVAMGPYPLPYARRVARELRPFAPEGVYIKPGK